MRNRFVGAIAATAIAAAALVACSPPNEQPSDIKVTDQEKAEKPLGTGSKDSKKEDTKKSGAESESASESEAAAESEAPAEGAAEPAAQ
ncbi:MULTISPECIES: hypothetical protein [unclassified Corynebacterium]|uniref:hypothetical protein n=1 Tax=unclassified Corynebacterium TaxID=2624378 RepID=UPI0030A03CB3